MKNLPSADKNEAEPSCESLVSSWLEGDGSAAEKLIRRHQKTIYRMMLRSTGDPHAAEDLTQKTFLKALLKVDNLKKGNSFRAWLIQIALNISRSRARSLFRWRRAPDYELDRMHSSIPGADEALDRGLKLQKIREAIRKLPRRHQEIVEMRLNAELPFSVIAEVMDTSEDSAKVTYHNAVRNLRGQIGEIS